MGVMIAPVLGSGCAPACMNLVPKLFLLLILFYLLSLCFIISLTRLGFNFQLIIIRWYFLF